MNDLHKYVSATTAKCNRSRLGIFPELMSNYISALTSEYASVSIEISSSIRDCLSILDKVT
jgi:hypothetical protein